MDVRSRSNLARHRKRKLLESTQHVSAPAQVDAALALAAATTATRTKTNSTQVVNDVLQVLRNPKNSVYHRGTTRPLCWQEERRY